MCRAKRKLRAMKIQQKTHRTLESLHDMFEGVPHLMIYKAEHQVWVLRVSQSSTAN